MDKLNLDAAAAVKMRWKWWAKQTCTISKSENRRRNRHRHRHIYIYIIHNENKSTTVQFLIVVNILFTEFRCKRECNSFEWCVCYCCSIHTFKEVGWSTLTDVALLEPRVYCIKYDWVVGFFGRFQVFSRWKTVGTGQFIGQT